MKTQENCTKICFTSQEDASKELHRIVESNDYRDWKQKSPVREYLCPLHGAEEIWHLTSQPSVKHYTQ